MWDSFLVLVGLVKNQIKIVMSCQLMHGKRERENVCVSEFLFCFSKKCADEIRLADRINGCSLRSMHLVM